MVVSLEILEKKDGLGQDAKVGDEMQRKMRELPQATPIETSYTDKM
jgi:hypothetical protein